MKLRTTFKISKGQKQINHATPLLSIGSCFAENIGQRMKKAKFQMMINPFGILYNPISIAQALDILQYGWVFDEADLFYHNEQWHSFLHHSQFSDVDKNKVVTQINESIREGQQQLKKADFLLLTLGTAFTYYLKSNAQPVANCHKLPQKQFEKRRLTIHVIVETLGNSLKNIIAQHPNLQIILTVSPVRHVRDGVLENQVSKSILRLAVEELQATIPNCSYFPAYELVIDDLRDYRFFERDLVHPNELAIDYIWNQFSAVYFSDDTLQLIKQFQKLRKAMEHRPFNPMTKQHQQFLKKNAGKVATYKQQFPDLDFREEAGYF